MPVLHDATIVALAQRCGAGALVATAIGVAAERMRALTPGGAVAAIVIGALSFAFGGLLVALAVIIFFASGSLLGRIGNAAAEMARALATKSAQRDAAQVIANGGAATLCAIVGGIAAAYGSPHASRWMIAAVCAIAAPCGDTWSTEIGALFGGRPRRISDMRTVPQGTSGGVTLLGTLAAPAGGALVGCAGAVAKETIALPAWIVVSAMCGLVGSVIDSVLGATVQGQWHCPRCERSIESPRHVGCDGSAVLQSGFAWLDNDLVNAVASFFGAAFGYAVAARMA